MKVWSVVHTLAHQERRAESNLIRQGYRAWLPVMKRSRRHARRIDTVKVPLFPGYLFVELDPDREPWSKINNTYGVRHLLSDGTRPRALSADFIHALRETVCPEGVCSPLSESLNPGTEVRITAGPFVGYLAKIVNTPAPDRIRLLLEILGGSVSTTVPRTAVTPVA